MMIGMILLGVSVLLLVVSLLLLVPRKCPKDNDGRGEQVRCVSVQSPVSHPSKCFDCERENVFLYPSHGDPRLHVGA